MIWTWKEIKKEIEDAGVKDDEEIDWIDISKWHHIKVKKYKDGICIEENFAEPREPKKREL